MVIMITKEQEMQVLENRVHHLEQNTPEPRLELFARNKRQGWDCWGSEVESDIELR